MAFASHPVLRDLVVLLPLALGFAFSLTGVIDAICACARRVPANLTGREGHPGLQSIAPCCQTRQKDDPQSAGRGHAPAGCCRAQF
jgi:hypothetical protein